MDPAGSGDEMNFYGKEQPISLSVGYKFDNEINYLPISAGLKRIIRRVVHL